MILFNISHFKDNTFFFEYILIDESIRDDNNIEFIYPSKKDGFNKDRHTHTDLTCLICFCFKGSSWFLLEICPISKQLHQPVCFEWSLSSDEGAAVWRCCFTFTLWDLCQVSAGYSEEDCDWLIYFLCYYTEVIRGKWKKKKSDPFMYWLLLYDLIT